jgi:hypothetical protein
MRSMRCMDVPWWVAVDNPTASYPFQRGTAVVSLELG